MRDFKEILQDDYNLEAFECRGCDNLCTVLRGKFEGGRKIVFAEDRCDKFSARHTENLGGGLPDLFEERERLLFNIYKAQPRENARTIGMPRGLMFNELFPFFNAFFSELGFDFITSEETNKSIIGKGLEKTRAEPCYPIKVAAGHLEDIVQKTDTVFMPAIIDLEAPDWFNESYTCTYIQSAPEVLGAAVGVKDVEYLTPRLFFKRGKRHVKGVLTDLGKGLGKTAEEVERALDAAYETQHSFRKGVAERGEEILANLGEQRAAVVFARSYAYDNLLNMNISKKLQQMGILAIPSDFLYDSSINITDSWSNFYAVQLQKFMAVARRIKKDKRLNAVVVDYFGCGPNAFGNQFLAEELQEKFVTIQIDEHTADAGVQTRLEAFFDTKPKKESVADRQISTTATPLNSIGNKKLWIPNMSSAAYVFAAVLLSQGIDAAVIPRSPDPELKLARSHIPGDVCLPTLFTTEDMLYRIQQEDFNPDKEVFFQGKSEGPCRYGMYYMLQKLLLNRHFPDVEIVTLGNRDTGLGLGANMTTLAWDAIVTHDILEKMLLHSRPYETEAGSSDGVFESYVKELCNIVRNPDFSKGRGYIIKSMIGLHLGALEDILHRAQKAFSDIPKKEEEIPLVGVAGEFYVRDHEPSNERVIRSLEDLGAEVWFDPISGFFGYSNKITHIRAKEKGAEEPSWANLKQSYKRYWLDFLAVRDEHKLMRTAMPYLEGREEPTPAELIRLGSQYIDPSFGGEAICTVGIAEHFIKNGVSGIVNVGPFNCMPTKIAEAMSYEIRKKHQIPILTLYYNGFPDSARGQMLKSFMSQVKEYKRSREAVSRLL